MGWALARGADAVRTGLEDNIRVSKDRLACGNAELVAIAAELVARHGGRPATPGRGARAPRSPRRLIAVRDAVRALQHQPPEACGDSSRHRPVQLATGLVAFLFGATGALAIILAVGTGGGLSERELASFVFGVFAINGVLTLLMVWLYGSRSAFSGRSPATVLIGPASRT